MDIISPRPPTAAGNSTAWACLANIKGIKLLLVIQYDALLCRSEGSLLQGRTGQSNPVDFVRSLAGE